MWCYRKTAAKSRLKSHEDFVQIEQGTRVGFEQLNAEVLKIRDRVALIPSEYASDASRLYHFADTNQGYHANIGFVAYHDDSCLVGRFSTL